MGHDSHEEHNDEHHPIEDISKHIHAHIRIYITVFIALMGLTLVTVAASYLQLSVWQTIAIALFIATVKGSLVAGFFMHLISEKKVIYIVLIFAAVFIIGLFFGSLLFHEDIVRN